MHYCIQNAGVMMTEWEGFLSVEEKRLPAWWGNHSPPARKSEPPLPSRRRIPLDEKAFNTIDLIDIAATSGWSLSVKLSDKFASIMFTGESLEI